MLDIKLEKKPKRGAVVIEGFPGFGLVGTITTEFLLKHLNAKQIGYIHIEEIQPMIAVHDGEPIQPLGIFYDDKNNIVILHALVNVSGFEWKLADKISDFFKEIGAKEMISIEGIGATHDEESDEVVNAFCISTNKKLTSIIPTMKEGIIVGVTGALLLRKDLNQSFVFAETHSALPDSRAAAKIIEVLDKYLGLKIDYKPLISQAEKFEQKLKEIMQKSQQTQVDSDKKKLTYLG